MSLYTHLSTYDVKTTRMSAETVVIVSTFGLRICVQIVLTHDINVEHTRRLQVVVRVSCGVFDSVFAPA